MSPVVHQSMCSILAARVEVSETTIAVETSRQDRPLAVLRDLTCNRRIDTLFSLPDRSHTTRWRNLPDDHLGKPGRTKRTRESIGQEIMQEGWYGEDYLILYDESESSAASERYGLATSLPGFELLGLLRWDDFIVRDASGAIYTVPTVPLDQEFLEPSRLSFDVTRLMAHPRFTGKIKWYKQPVAFGGNPWEPENLSWISHDEHARVVRLWNDRYRERHGRSRRGQGIFWRVIPKLSVWLQRT
jgi:hypothetical protein